MGIVALVIEEVHKHGGAFIKRDRRSKLWVEAELHLIRNKISQLFRSTLSKNQSDTRRKQHKQIRIDQTKTMKQDNCKVDTTFNNMFEPIKVPLEVKSDMNFSE